VHPERLYIVRHGETDWNREGRVQGHADIPLNENGRRQAAAIAERLRGTTIDAIYSSDLQRAAATARAIGEAVAAAPILTPVWREMNVGELEGTKGFENLFAKAARSKEPIAKGAETIVALTERVLAGWERICREQDGRSVVLVGHGGTLKGFICHLVGLDPGNIDRLSLRGNCGLSIFEFPCGTPRLTLFNDTGHIA